MKTLLYGSALVVLTVLCVPTTSDAFSRRSHSSEVAPTQSFTTHTSSTENGNVNAQAVAEPPVLLLMSIGIGAFALCSGIIRYRKQS